MKARLDREQEALLALMVEAQRNVPRSERSRFYVVGTMGSPGYLLVHPGLMGDNSVPLSDLKALAYFDLVDLRRESRTQSADITPAGFAYYDEMKRGDRTPLGQLEEEVHRYLEDEDFTRSHSAAFSKWKGAADKLWSSETEGEYTTIGHLCREAMQLFASGVGTASTADLPIDKTVVRIRQTLASLGASDADRPFLDGLLTYWGNVSDLVQRQEHGQQKEAQGKPLVWEDARRVVFQTAVVMFELDRAIRRYQS